MSNNELVLEYIKQNGSITQRTAAEDLNVWRLSSVINRLRGSGHQIVTISRTGDNGARYAEYRMK